MGKALSKGLKVKGNQLIEFYEDKLSLDFQKNKDFIDSLGLPFFKKTRNLLAGYIVRQLKKKKD